MSNFGAKLAEILERKKLSQSELAKLSQIDDTIISRWITGRQRFVSAADLEIVCTQISTLPKERAELVRAHLFDEIPNVVADLIDVTIRGKAVPPELTPDYRATLPLPIQRALEILGREAVTDSDVRSMILSLADLLSKSRQAEHQLNEPVKPATAHPIATDVVAEAVYRKTRKRSKPKPSQSP